MAIHEIPIPPSEYVNKPFTSEDFQNSGFVTTLANGKTHRITDTEMRTAHNIFTHWTSGGLNEASALDNFNRFYSIFPDMEMPTDLKSYIFITRPEMNLFGDESSGSQRTSGTHPMQLATDNSGDMRLRYLSAMNPEILHMLTKDYSSDHDFIPYLQGRSESLQLPDYQIRTSEMSVPFYNYKFEYPTVTNESITGGSFDITFREDSELRITKMFQFWIYYMDAIVKNKMRPTRDHIINNYYDFMCSVYEIICDPSSERILYWAKYTGCFPTNVPISNLSHNIRSTMDNKVSISFNYIMVEAMDPRVLGDFANNTTVKKGVATKEVYDETFGMVGESLVGSPTIVPDKSGNGFLLKWYPRVSGTSSKLVTTAPTLINYQKADANAAKYKSQRNPVQVQAFTPGRNAPAPTGVGSFLSINSDRV